MIKCCTTDKRSGICWLLFFLTQNNNSFPFHVLTFNSNIIFLLLSLLFIILYLLLLCSTTCWLHFFLTKTRLLSLSCSHLWLSHSFSIPKLSFNPPFSFLLHRNTTTHLTWQAIDAPKSNSLAKGRQEFHLHSIGFEAWTQDLFEVLGTHNGIHPPFIFLFIASFFYQCLISNLF
jgi:hypothetical protein